MYNFTSIMWVKDETPYIPEWIEFHLIQGVDHFILYNDDSIDGIYEALEPYISAGLLEIRLFPDELVPLPKNGLNTKCFWVMDYCIEEQRGKTRWAFFHAIDEFLFTKDHTSLSEFMKDFDEIGALGVEWEQFSSGGHVTRPSGLTIENYTRTFYDQFHHIKMIFRPDCAVSNNGTTHAVILNNGWLPVNERFYPLFGSMNTDDPGFFKIKIHHYTVKSREEFEEKQNKGYLDLPGSRHAEWMNDTWFDFEHSDRPRGNCTDLLKYKDVVREAILNRYAGKEDLLEKYKILY